MDVEKYPITVLPNEILTKVLKYVSTIDLFNFCEAFTNFDYFLEEKAVTTVINLSDHFEMDLKMFKNYMKKIRPLNISVLNLNHIYWLPAKEIGMVVKKCVNIEELYLLHTKLGLSEANHDFFALPKLKKLAVVTTPKDFSGQRLDHLEHLESLCLHIVYEDIKNMDYYITALICIIRKSPPLKELWVNDENDKFECFQFCLPPANNLERFVFKGRSFLPYEDILFMDRLWSNNSGAHKELYYEYNIRGEENVTKKMDRIKENKDWSILIDDLHSHWPFGLRDVKNLVKSKNLQDLKIEEINLAHQSPCCSPRLQETIEKILASDENLNLKKLSINNCIYSTKSTHSTEHRVYNGTNSYKKRIGTHEIINSGKHKDVLKNIEFLEVLEISLCSRARNSELYTLIPYLKNLHTLKLDIPSMSLSHGKFLPSVFQKCEQIKTFKVKILGENEPCHTNLLKALVEAKSLKNLRFEATRIKLNNFFKTIIDSPNLKILTLYIECKWVETDLDTNLVAKFFNENPQLLLFVLIITEATAAILRSLRKVFSEFKKKPVQIFLVKKDNQFSQSLMNIFQNVYDVMNPESCVSVLNIPFEFVTPSSRQF